MAAESQLWVGKSANWLYVYDPELQPRPELRLPDEIFIYLVGESKARAFNASALRSSRMPTTTSEVTSAREEYSSWSKPHRAEFVAMMEKINDKIVNRHRFEQEEMLKKHRQYLDGIGRKYEGVQHSQQRSSRVTHCYACKSHLDGKFHVACSACDWLICQCGACGCEFGRT